eukprot:11020650-Alexandrium_andersonii.AAC.1
MMSGVRRHRPAQVGCAYAYWASSWGGDSDASNVSAHDTPCTVLLPVLASACGEAAPVRTGPLPEAPAPGPSMSQLNPSS